MKPVYLIPLALGAGLIWLAYRRDEESTLKRGDNSAEVAYVQEILSTHGLDVGPIDGIFGPRTQAAVMEYQRRQKLPETGIVDRATLAALEAD